MNDTESAEALANKSHDTDVLMQETLAEKLSPASLRSSGESFLEKEVQPLLRHVAPDRVPHGALRRIERNGLSVQRGLSFKSQMVAMSESRKIDSIRPSWQLDRKNTAYRFLDSLGIRRPDSDTSEYKFNDIPTSFPSVVKATRSTGSRGVYLLFSENRILHARDSRALTSIEEFRSHANHLMGRGNGAKTRRPLPDRWMREELILEDSTSLAPARDFKFYCFYGEIVLMQESERIPSLQVAFWDVENRPVKTGRYEDKPLDGIGIKSDHLNIVKQISEQIPFPFMRIDMLNGESELIFGEFTPRPGKFQEFNSYWDRTMGEAWAAAQSRLTRDMLSGKRFDTFTQATGILDKH